jgi:hypothetical protein
MKWPNSGVEARSRGIKISKWSLDYSKFVVSKQEGNKM